MIHLREHYLRRQIKNFDMQSFDRPAGGKGKAAIVARPKGCFFAKDVQAFPAGGETTRSKEKLSSSSVAKLGVAERAIIVANAKPNRHA